jgi:hypothetical protein
VRKGSLALLSAAALAALLACGARAQNAVRLENAAPAEVARELTRVLAVPVEVAGGVGRTATFEGESTVPSRLLGQAAGALGGTWRMRLHVRGGGGAAPFKPPVLEQTLSLGLQDITAARAFSVIARELKAELVLEGALDRRVAAIGVNVPASNLLNRVAEQAGAVWWISYVIRAPDVPAPPRVRPRPEPVVLPRRPALPPPDPVVPTSPVERPRVLSGPELKAALREGIQRVLRAVPDRRPEAVREVTDAARALFAPLALLTPIERSARLQHARPLLSQWRKVYRGAAPAVQKELASANELLEANLR